MSTIEKKNYKRFVKDPKKLIPAVVAAGVGLAVTAVAEPMKQNEDVKKRLVTTKKRL